MAPGAEPLSIESLLQRQKEEREAAARVSSQPVVLTWDPVEISRSFFLFSKPKFLSKEERAKIAIAKRAQEIQEERRKEEENRKNREQLEREAEIIRRQERESKYATSNATSSRRL
jgi:ATP-dependent RNA helicase DDX23/PRP28